jgi:hypothetical protein
MTNSAVQSHRLGVIGCVVGLLALIAAVLPHWVVPAMFPPPQSEQVKTDTGQRPLGRLIGRFIGHREVVEHQIGVREEGFGDRLSGVFSTAAVSLGLLAIVLAVLSLIFREERLYAGVSAALGTVALAIEVAYMLTPFVFIFLALLFFFWVIS